jgi:hypothetical protein
VRLCRPGNSFCGSSGGGWYWGWGCAARASIRDAAREVERLWILWTLWTNRVAPGAGPPKKGIKRADGRGCGSRVRRLCRRKRAAAPLPLCARDRPIRAEGRASSE